MRGLGQAIGDMRIEDARRIFRDMRNNNENYQIFINEFIDGLSEVGNRYAEGRYFIADLMVSGMLAKELLSELKISTDSKPGECKGKVLIATVFEDIHDIGKDLVKDCLEIYGFEVTDMGVDVSNEKILNAIGAGSFDILALSCIMAGSVKYTFDLMNKLENMPSSSEIKIVLGGGGFTEEMFAPFALDIYVAKDLFDGLNYCVHKDEEPEKQR